jgi:hypothetical protein
VVKKISTIFIYPKCGDSFQKKMRTLQQNMLFFIFTSVWQDFPHTPKKKKKKKKAEKEVLRLTWLIEKITWKRSLCFNFPTSFA